MLRSADRRALSTHGVLAPCQPCPTWPERAHCPALQLAWAPQGLRPCTDAPDHRRGLPRLCPAGLRTVQWAEYRLPWGQPGSVLSYPVALSEPQFLICRAELRAPVRGYPRDHWSLGSGWQPVVVVTPGRGAFSRTVHAQSQATAPHPARVGLDLQHSVSLPTTGPTERIPSVRTCSGGQRSLGLACHPFRFPGPTPASSAPRPASTTSGWNTPTACKSP